MKNITVFFLLTGVLFAGTVFADAFAVNRRLGRGMNMGNMLEAPSEGEWGVVLQEEYFRIIKERGFDSVRIPVRWSAEGRAAKKKPFRISESFFRRMDRAVDAALKADLAVVLNFHHYEELFKNAQAEEARFKAIWEQIARRYKDRSDNLLFEIMNEPNGDLTVERWNKLYPEVLGIIRRSNPERVVVVGTADWGGIGALKSLKLPPDDKNLIVTVHYYNPFPFTHQGAEWVGRHADAWLGMRWTGDYYEKTAVVDEMEGVATWAKAAGVPVYVGEFGAYGKADMESRARWTAYCARLFEEMSFSWAYWEFCSGFGAYDATAGRWREELASALISEDKSVLAIPSRPEVKGRNIVLNGDFTKGTEGWTFGAWAGKAEGAVTNGVFRFKIEDPGSEGWNIQLLQTGLRFRNGKSYLVSFDAWAESARSFSSGVENADKYTGYGSSGSLTAGPKKKSYVYRFTKAGGDDPNGRVSFSFGGEAATVFIGNVKVVELE